MIQIICISFLVVSFLVIIFIFWKKIPCLKEIDGNKKSNKNYSTCLFLKRIKSIHLIQNFSWHRMLLKFLSKVRIGILKIENKLNDCLNKLRAMSQKNKK